MLDRFHPPIEEYLEAIFGLEEEGIPVIQARLAERLDKAAPSVSEMLDRMETDGLIMKSARRIAMTEEGAAIARGVVRKHRLAERLLVDIIGLDWEKAHHEAGRWEHVISDDVEERLVVLLGNPSTCPHGNPIPGAATAGSGQTVLSEAEPGDRVRLERITESVEHEADALRYLGGHGLTPGATAVIREKAPDGTLTLEIGATTIALGRAMTERMFVASA
ncbi:MAG: metal-dependent transcriptional regulator [Acidimicrobiales bacterium]